MTVPFGAGAAGLKRTTFVPIVRGVTIHASKSPRRAGVASMPASGAPAGSRASVVSQLGFTPASAAASAAKAPIESPESFAFAKKTAPLPKGLRQNAGWSPIEPRSSQESSARVSRQHAAWSVVPPSETVAVSLSLRAPVAMPGKASGAAAPYSLRPIVSPISTSRPPRPTHDRTASHTPGRTASTPAATSTL